MRCATGLVGPLLLLSFGQCLSAQSQPSSISLNFQGSTGRAVTASAGVVSASGWNNVAGGSATALVLRDESGADRGARLTFSSASNGYRLNPPATSPDGALFDGQIITNAGGGPATVTITGVPYSRYDAYVYFGHGPSFAGFDVELGSAATTFAFQNEPLQTYTDPVGFRQVTSATVPGQTGNYAVFTAQTSTSFTAVLRPANSGSPGSSGISGLQIVDRGSDSDQDGLDDAWELQWFNSLSQGPNDDPDGDALANLGEYLRGTVPVDPDTDDDLSLDGAEILRGTDPLDADSDDDELQDGVETDTSTYVSPTDTGTDPLDRDSDGDGAGDGAEVRRGSNPCDPQSVPDLPNVILIMADDLGWGELGSYGQTLIRTPHLDQLAQQGMRFSQFYCGSPVCAPTRSTIQEGKHTGHCQIRNNRASAALDPGTFTIGRMMQNEGYVTACIGKWGNGNTGSTGHPNLQGYDHFFGFLDQTHAHWFYPSYLWRNAAQVAYPTNNGVAGPGNNGTVHAQDEMTREALQWIDQNHQRPFFLYLAFTVPHVSLQEPPHSDPTRRALGETSVEEFYPGVNWPEPNANFASSHYTSNARPRGAYAAMISAMDRDVGLIMQRLAQYGIDNDTLVLFTSDNGTTYCCGVDRQFFNSLGGLRGYKGEVYEGGIRVPMIARWPGRVPAGTTTNHVAAVWDIFATLADVVDAEVPADLDGVSFLPAIEGRPECQEAHEYLYWEYEQGGTRRKAVRVGDFKGVRYGDAGAGVAMQLYDLANDPAETVDVAAAHPAVASQIERTMAARHVFEPEFWRQRDEFPVLQGVTLANANPMIRLDAPAAGLAQAPLLRDVSTSLSVPFVAQIDNVTGRAANVSLVLSDGVGTTSAVEFVIDAAAGQFRIESGGASFQAAMPPGTDPYGRFELTCVLDVVLRSARIETGGVPLVSGQFSAAPARITHHGFGLVNSSVRIEPLDPALAGRWRARWSPFGSGCPGTVGTPLLRAVPGSVPAPSACFDVEVSGLPQQSPIALGVIGFSNTSSGGLPLPLALDPVGMPQCLQWVSSEAVVGLSAAQGRARWRIALPAAVGLLGVTFHQQAIVLDPGANAAGAVVSNAGTGVVGGR